MKINKKDVKEKELLIENTVLIGSLLREKMDAVQKLSLLLQAKKNLDVLDQMNLSSKDKTKLEESKNNVEDLIGRLSDPTFVESIVKTANNILKSISLK